MACSFAPRIERIQLSTRERKRREHLEKCKVTRQTQEGEKASPDPKRLRRQDWSGQGLDDPERYEEMDLPAQERVRARGEIERRKAARGAGAGSDQGRKRAFERDSAGRLAGSEPGHSSGIVIEVGPGRCLVEVDGGAVACG